MLEFVRRLRGLLGSGEGIFADCGISRDRLPFLLYSRSHSPYLARHRALVINTRMRIFAAIFAVLLLLWIPVDYLFLPDGAAGTIAVMRLVSSLLFFLLAFSVTVQNRWEYARLRLVLLMLAPLAFYLGVQLVFSGIEADTGGIVLIDIYNLLPFIVVAGLAVFPLTVLETVTIGLLSILVMALGPLLSAHFQPASFIPAVWVLLLILGICTMAAAIQLNYMSSLIRRISIDTLTGAFTRQSGQELLDLYFELSVEQGEPFAVAFFDLDDFKAINDNYGHEAGDAALCRAVKQLQQLLRRGDQVVRWGGEEFLVILIEADRPGLELVLGRITSEWLGQRPDGSVLTASVGVAERQSDHAKDWLELVELADKRMYRAKQEGKARARMDDA